jgi:hypothetical protein
MAKLQNQVPKKAASVGNWQLTFLGSAWAVADWPSTAPGWIDFADSPAPAQAAHALVQAWHSLVEEQRGPTFEDLCHRIVLGIDIAVGQPIQHEDPLIEQWRNHITLGERAKQIVLPLWNAELAVRAYRAKRCPETTKAVVAARRKARAVTLDSMGGITAWDAWDATRTQRTGWRVYPSPTSRACPSCNTNLPRLLAARLRDPTYVGRCNRCGVLLAQGKPEGSS